MENLIGTILNAIEAMPWLLLVGAAVLILLPVIVMGAVQASARRRWQQENADQIDRYEMVSKKAREANEQLDEKERALKKLQADEETWKAERADWDHRGEELSTQLSDSARTLGEKESELEKLQEEKKAWEEERAELMEKARALDNDLAGKISALEQKESALEQLQEEKKVWEEERAELTERARALDNDLEEKTRTLDQLYVDQESWKRQKDEILASAHEAAEHIIDEASHRLAESEEEVRRNRLIAAGSLNDARRRISEMLLSAASELNKGLPAPDSEAPIGYAPVYSIQDSRAEEEGKASE